MIKQDMKLPQSLVKWNKEMVRQVTDAKPEMILEHETVKQVCGIKRMHKDLRLAYV